MLRDADYYRKRAEACRNSAFRTAEGEQTEDWLYLADLWEELAETMSAVEPLPTIH